MFSARILGLLFFFGWTFSIQAQKTVRYLDDVFTQINTTTVKYGRNASLLTDTIDLWMDIYQPANDTITKRPTLILAFGGAFITGDRGQLADLAKSFTRLGYVTACIDYRIWPIFLLGFPDSTAVADVAVKAVSDMKASIRFLKSEASKYKIDTNLIFAGGVSAGAITAIQTAYLDPNDSIPPFLRNLITKNGGFRGSSNNATLQHSEKIAGVLNLSGGILSLDFLDSSEPPIASMHGTADATVPYLFGKAAGLVSIYGSGALHPALQQKKIKEILQTVPGGGHTDIYIESKFASYVDSFTTRSKKFFYDIINPQQTVSIKHEVIHKANLYPNPAFDHIIIKTDIPVLKVKMYDLMGRTIPSSFSGELLRWSSRLTPGIYSVELLLKDRSRLYSKIIVQ